MPDGDARVDDGDARRVAEAKGALRRRLRAARRARAHDEGIGRRLAVTAGQAPPLRDLVARGGGTVLAYAAVPGEPDPGPVREWLRGNGVRVVLPVVTGPGALAWGTDDGHLAPGRELPGGLRLPEPDPATAVPLAALDLTPDDVLLVPALAVSRDGTRLGQGGGFYDRALADLPRHPDGPLVAAVVHDDELLAQVPGEPHDLRVDAALTPSAWEDLARGT